MPIPPERTFPSAELVDRIISWALPLLARICASAASRLIGVVGVKESVGASSSVSRGGGLIVLERSWVLTRL